MAGTSEGGKKAAETRRQNPDDHETRVRAGEKAAETRGYESLSEAGRKGGEHSHGGSSQSGHGQSGSNQSSRGRSNKDD